LFASAAGCCHHHRHRLLVAAFFIDREEAGELDDLARGAQLVLAGAFAQGHGRALDRRRGHLAGQRALPDQVVEPRSSPLP
jgi:hypothetical protein